MVKVARIRDAGGAWAELSVQDTGVGVPEAEQDAIFEPFQRGSNVAGTTRGTGLGLAGTLQIVQQHGGSIHVHSQPGIGSTFTVRLPLDI